VLGTSPSASHPRSSANEGISEKNIAARSAIFIPENGCATDDVPADDGKVYDNDRVMFLRAHLTQLQRATADGVPVKGYFQWSTMDNFEWIFGLGNRFGLLYVDFKTQKRTPKLSAEWFREAAKRNAVI
jgi:beta-glucosidase